jgi:hypothetical protein
MSFRTCVSYNPQAPAPEFDPPCAGFRLVTVRGVVFEILSRNITDYPVCKGGSNEQRGHQESKAEHALSP